MENDLIFGTDASDTLTGPDAGDTQLAAAPATEAAAFGDALPVPLDAAQVVVPQGENVVREPVTPGEVVELPFPPDSQFLARIDNGNLAIKVGDVTIILQGYVEAAGQTPPVIEASNGQPLDIATILASTDPNIDIQTAAGPSAGAQGQGADNTGGILTLFGEGAGLGGFAGAGAQDATDALAGGTVDQTGTLFRQFGALLPATAPEANDDVYATNEDTALTIPAPGVLGNDTDPNGDPLTVSSITQPANGTVTVNPDGSFTYTPNANYNGPDSFTYTADDGNGNTSTATVVVNVSPVNDAPVANPDAYTTNEDTPLTIAGPGVLTNDTDVDGDPLTASVATQPAHGTVTVNPDGSFTYTPNANYHGPDSFTYTADDGNGGTATGTVALTVNPVNDAPVAADDSYTTNEDTPLVIAAPGILTNDTDVEGDPLTVSVVTGPAHGTLTANADGSFTYTPDANYNGPDSFTYKANDGTDDSNVATVNIGVTPVNDAPVAVNDTYTTNEDTPLVIAAPGLLTNDTDVEGDALTASVVTGPAHGTLTANADGSFTYTPDADYNGPDSFTYKANDGTDDSNIATVNIGVTAVNDLPKWAGGFDSANFTEDTPNHPQALNWIIKDVDDTVFAITVDNSTLPDGVTYDSVNKKINFDTQGHYDYLKAGESETYTIKFTITDAHGGSVEKDVTVKIDGVNDAPVAANDTYTTNEDTALTIAAPGILGNDTDVEGDTLHVGSIVTGPAHGSLIVNSDGSLLYTPDADYNGTDSFTYKANDGTANSNIATVNLNVTAVNDLPKWAGGFDATTFTEDTPNHPQALNWIIKDVDDTVFAITVDNSTLPDGVTYDSVNKKINFDTEGKYDYLAAGESETYTVKFTITDAHGGSIEKDVTVKIDGVADAADAVDDTILTNVGLNNAVNPFANIPEWALIANDKDSSTEDLAYPGLSSVVGLAGTAQVAGVGTDGTVQFTDDFTLGGSLKYELTDGSQATLTIKNQSGGDLAGTTAHEIIVSGSVAGGGDKIDGHGGKDLIFGGGGDDTFIFHHGDTVVGGTDSIAASNALAASATRGDVLAIDHDVNFTQLDLAHSGGIETISTAAADGGAGAQSLTIGASTVTSLSDHTITPGALFTSEKDAVRVDGDAVDQLYLSISKDGGHWADTGVDVNGYHVFAHETVANDATTADAYVMVAAAVVPNVHLNQDAP